MSLRNKTEMVELVHARNKPPIKTFERGIKATYSDDKQTNNGKKRDIRNSSSINNLSS